MDTVVLMVVLEVVTVVITRHLCQNQAMDRHLPHIYRQSLLLHHHKFTVHLLLVIIKFVLSVFDSDKLDKVMKEYTIYKTTQVIQKRNCQSILLLFLYSQKVTINSFWHLLYLLLRFKKKLTSELKIADARIGHYCMCCIFSHIFVFLNALSYQICYIFVIELMPNINVGYIELDLYEEATAT